MNEPAESKQIKESTKTAAQPFYGRLSISNLFLITTGSALAIWLQNPAGFTNDRTAVVIAATFAPIYGIAFAALVISLSHRPARPFATEPGHWLLLFVAAASGCLLYIFRLAVSLQAVQQKHLPIAEVAVLGVGLVAMPLLLFLAPVLLLA